MATEISLFGSPSGLFPGSNTATGLQAAVTGATNATATNFSDGDGSEVLFELCNHFYDCVASGDATKVTATSTTNAVGSNIVKSYTFNFTCAVDVANLDVVSE